MRKRTLIGPTLAAAALLASSGARAQSELVSVQLPQEVNLVGLGAFSVPDYYGSDKNEGVAAPIFRYQFQGTKMYAQVLGTEAVLNLVNRDEIRAGPLIRVRQRRDDDVDDEVVRRMRPVASATEIGAFAAYHMPVDARPLHKVIFYADVVGNTTGVYNGLTGNVRATYVYPFEQGLMGKPLIGHIGFGLFWASESFNRTYFGVFGDRDLAQFPELSGREVRPDAGLTSIKIPFGLTSQVSPNWLITVAGRYEALTGDAKDSPIVDRRGDSNQWAIGIAASYIF